MLIELFLDQDEPRTLTEVYLRKLYHAFLGREPDANGLAYYANLLDNGHNTWQQVSDSILSTAEYQNYLQQANGNPVVILQRRDFDGNPELTEVAFNTNYDRQTFLNYTQTGDLLSLPYAHRIYIQNRLASREVNVNPFGVSSFVGVMSLDPPEQSLTFSSTSTPTVLNDPIDGYTSVLNSYKASLAAKQGLVVNQDNDSGFYGSYYGEWELLSQGTNEIDRKKYTYTRTDQWAKYKVNFDVKPTVLTNTSKNSRTDKVYDPNIKPKMNDVDISFKADGLKPNTRLYAFFGDRAVSDRCVSYLKRPDGTDITLQILVTDSVGTIRGKFSYRESDLNFDAAIINFALSDSNSNGPNRTTYVSMPFNSLSLPGYGEETVRTRVAQIATNKTTERVALEPRTVIVNDAGPVSPASIDIIDYVFVYGLGRKPSAQEKAAIYDKWVSYGIAEMSAWNAIENRYTNNNAATPGVEMIHPWGWTVNHPILTYVDRAVSVVPNGSDSSDLRSKYLAAATYPYGRWTWYWIDTENPYPATINTAQFMATEPTPLTPPWITDISYNSFNAAGEKVFRALRNFCNDVLSINNNDYSKVFTGGVAGIAARELGLIDAEGKISSTPASLPKTFVARKHDIDWSDNTHTITSVWDSVLTNSCQQVSGATWSPPPTVPPSPPGPPANIFALKLDVVIQPSSYGPQDYNFLPEWSTISNAQSFELVYGPSDNQNKWGINTRYNRSDYVWLSKAGQGATTVPDLGFIRRHLPIGNDGSYYNEIGGMPRNYTPEGSAEYYIENHLYAYTDITPMYWYRPIGFNPVIEGLNTVTTAGAVGSSLADFRYNNPAGKINFSDASVYGTRDNWPKFETIRAETQTGNVISIAYIEAADYLQFTDVNEKPDTLWYDIGFQVDQGIWPVETVGPATTIAPQNVTFIMPFVGSAWHDHNSTQVTKNPGINQPAGQYILPSNNYVNYSFGLSVLPPRTFEQGQQPEWYSELTALQFSWFNGASYVSPYRTYLYRNEAPGFTGRRGTFFEVDKIKDYTTQATNWGEANQSPIIQGTPYQLLGITQTSGWVGIAVGITKGQTGLSYPIPIIIRVDPYFDWGSEIVENLPEDTGFSFRTHIPAVHSSGNYWRNANGRTFNYVYVYLRAIYPDDIGSYDLSKNPSKLELQNDQYNNAVALSNNASLNDYSQGGLRLGHRLRKGQRIRMRIVYDTNASWTGPSPAPPPPPPPPPPSSSWFERLVDGSLF